MKSTENEVIPKAQEPIIVTPTTFDSDMPVAPQGLFADNLSTISLSPLGVETHSVPAIDPEEYARLLSKEGPIPQHDIDDNAVHIDAITRRLENADIQLVEGMTAADSLRLQATEQALADKEVARAERDKQRTMVESIKEQLIRSIDDWVEGKQSEIEALFKARTKVDDQITVVAGQIAEDAFRSFTNIRRALNAGTEALGIQGAQCQEAETRALQLDEKRQRTQAELREQRERFKEYNETLRELNERRKRIPSEMVALESAEKVERERLFDTYLVKNRKQFEMFDEDYTAALSRRQEIMDTGVSSVELDRILGEIKSKKEEKKHNDEVYSGCIALIKVCTREINRLEQVVSQIPEQIISQHKSFADASYAIRTVINQGTQSFADKAASLGPVALGETLLTQEDASRLGLLYLARRTQQLRILFTERQPLLDEEIDLDFSPAHDMPVLTDPFGEPVEIPAPRRFTSRSRAEQQESGVPNEEKPSIKHRVGRKMASMFFGSANINENTLVTPREIEA